MALEIAVPVAIGGAFVIVAVVVVVGSVVIYITYQRRRRKFTSKLASLAPEVVGK